QHCLFDAELAAEHQQRVETEKALGEAVVRDEFVLAFQPQMSLVTGELAGAEALLRWNHPRDGLRSPSTFIPIAERTGLIAEIGDWVITEMASTLAAWHRGGFDGRVAFNVSPRQLDRPDFFHKMRQAFGDAGVQLSMIELEFTESAAMEVGATVLDEIAALHAARPGETGPFADRRYRYQRESACHRPGGDSADQGRRMRSRRGGCGDGRPGRYIARDGLRHGSGLCLLRADVRAGIPRLDQRRPRAHCKVGRLVAPARSARLGGHVEG